MATYRNATVSGSVNSTDLYLPVFSYTLPVHGIRGLVYSKPRFMWRFGEEKQKHFCSQWRKKKKLLHKDREDDGVGGKLIEGREIKESNKVDAGCGSDGKRVLNPKMLDKSETQTKY